jgi:MSHA pilin protein MshC
MPNHKRGKGFTLIEVIAVLLIIAIIAVVVISRGTSTAEIDINAQAEALKSHIRYAQIRAMNMTSMTPYDPDTGEGCNATFGISTTSNTYFMFRDCSTGNKVVLPGASGDTITLKSGMTINTETFSFDTWGRPCTDPNKGITPATADINLGHGVIITRNTGYVP